MRRFRRLLLLAALAALLLWIFLPAQRPRIAEGSILVLELGGEYVEAPEPALIDRVLGDGRRPFVSVLTELAKARRDDRLAGVVLRIRRLQISWAMAQELRGAVADLRAAGRQTLAYLETGSFGANREYYVASAADQLVVSPGTSSPLLGLGMEVLFFGGLWEKLGVGVETIGRGEYKSAAEILGARQMSEAHREMAISLLDSTFAQFVAGIAEGRKLPEAAVREAIDRAPVTPLALERAGLVDASLSFDAAVARLGGGEVVDGEDYANVDPARVGFSPVARFALVYGSGAVTMGRGTHTPGGGMLLTSDTLSQAFEDAVGDSSIDAIIFRVDSPGGSPLASDIVWRAAERAKAAGKPLVASVSGVAASGGYYVLCGADGIVASPASLVGSIGVFVTRPVVSGLLERFDIGVETFKRGEYADLLLASQPLDARGRARLREEIDGIYDLFVSRVADGRSLSTEAVDAAGRGRVFTGEQALERGLVDELGGLRAAVARAARKLGLEPDADVSLVPFPTPRSLAEELADALQGAVARATPALPQAFARIEPLLRQLGDGGPLLVAPLAIEIR